MRLNLIFRKPYPTAFSFERLFDGLAAKFRERGLDVHRLTLPDYNNSISDVRSNIDWARAQEGSLPGTEPAVHHITGDVTSVIFAFRRPTVITFHDCNPLLRYPKWHPRYWFYRLFIYELPARRAAAITVISEKTREELLRLTNCPRDHRMHVIPNYVDPAFTYRPREFNADKPTILQVGVKENKNLSRLAAALRGIPCRLVIIGEPGEADRRALEENAISYSAATGLTDEEVRQRYVDCDLLAFVSTYEGFGLPILEAQVTGRPVVTADLSPHREVAGPDGAELVDPYDVSSIREGIRQVIADARRRAALTENGRRNAARYDIDAIAAQYIDLYQRLL